MVYSLLLKVLLLQVFTASVQGFASWFAADYCGSPLVPGEIIMNNAATMSDKRAVEVFRDNIPLKSGDFYHPGERLTAVLGGEDIGEMVWDSTVEGIYEDGGCEGRRSTLSTTTMIMPSGSAAAVNIEIWAGWALSHSTVWISNKFVLKGSGGVKGAQEDLASVESIETRQKKQRDQKQERDRQQLERERLEQIERQFGQVREKDRQGGTGEAGKPPQAGKAEQAPSDEQLLERQMLQQQKILEQQQRQRGQSNKGDRTDRGSGIADQWSRLESSQLLRDWKKLHDFTTDTTVLVLVAICGVALFILLWFYRRHILTYLGFSGKYGGGLKRYRSM